MFSQTWTGRERWALERHLSESQGQNQNTHRRSRPERWSLLGRLLHGLYFILDVKNIVSTLRHIQTKTSPVAREFFKDYFVPVFLHSEHKDHKTRMERLLNSGFIQQIFIESTVLDNCSGSPSGGFFHSGLYEVNKWICWWWLTQRWIMKATECLPNLLAHE